MPRTVCCKTCQKILVADTSELDNTGRVIYCHHCDRPTLFTVVSDDQPQKVEDPGASTLNFSGALDDEKIDSQETHDALGVPPPNVISDQKPS